MTSMNGLSPHDKDKLVQEMYGCDAYISCGIDPGRTTFAIRVEAYVNDPDGAYRDCLLFDVVNLGDKSQMVRNLILYMEKHGHILRMISLATIEGQIKPNGPMAKIEGVALTLLLQHMSMSATVRIVNTSKKNNLLKSAYSLSGRLLRKDAKKYAVSLVRHHMEIENDPYRDQFNKQSKKDDLADAYLYQRLHEFESIYA